MNDNSGHPPEQAAAASRTSGSRSRTGTPSSRELLQNARRAGASCVGLTYEPKAKRLVVRDDGCGIADFQTLLTLGESGWSEAVQRTEHPFGLGFLQSLYAAGQLLRRKRRAAGAVRHPGGARRRDGGRGARRPMRAARP